MKKISPFWSSQFKKNMKVKFSQRSNSSSTHYTKISFYHTIVVNYSFEFNSKHQGQRVMSLPNLLEARQPWGDSGSWKRRWSKAYVVVRGWLQNSSFEQSCLWHFWLKSQPFIKWEVEQTPSNIYELLVYYC